MVTALFSTTPQKQEAFKDFAVKQLLPPAQQPYPLNTVDVGQIESVINVRHNPNYCKVYELKVERPQKPLRDQNLCDNLRYKVVINGEPWAELIATDVFFSAPPSGVAATVGENRYVFAPCEEACDQPLKVEIFKSPGEACALKNAIDQNSPGLRKNPAGYTGLDSMDKVTEFDYDDCQNREILDLYYDSSVRQLLDSVEKRLDVMKVDTELLMREVKEAYPNAGDFNVSAVKVPGHYYERETAFQTQQYNDGFDEYDDYYDDFDEYNDGYDDYDDGYDDSSECLDGNCVDVGDIRKDIADFQNERLVQEVELLRKKVAWVEQTVEQQSFQTQQFNSNDFYNQRRKLKNDFYNVNTSGGCYDFYSNNARPKNPKPRNDDNGGGSGDGGNIPYEERCHGEQPSITLFSAIIDQDENVIIRGRVNHAPETCGNEPFDYQSLILESNESIIAESNPVIESEGFGFFKMTITGHASDDFINKVFSEKRFPKLPVHLKSCSGGNCMTSNRIAVRLITFKVKNLEISEEISDDFSTQSTPSGCNRFAVFGGPGGTHEQPITLRLDFDLSNISFPVTLTASGQLFLDVRATKGESVFSDHITFESYPPATLITGRSQRGEPKAVIKSVENHLSELTEPYVLLKYGWNGQRSLVNQTVPTGMYTLNKEASVFDIKSIGKFPLEAQYPIPAIFSEGPKTFPIFNYQEQLAKNIANTPRCGFKNPIDKTVATYRFENISGLPVRLGSEPAENVACSGRTSAPGTTPSPKQGIKGKWGELKFPPEIDEAKQGQDFPFKSINDSERKTLELFARTNNAHFNETGAVKRNNTLEGSLFMFVNRKACPQCEKLPQQFRTLFPKVGLFWVDIQGSCY